MRCPYRDSGSLSHWTHDVQEDEDPTHPTCVDKQYLQKLIESGQFEAELGHALALRTTHVYLEGNPAMIAIPHTNDDGTRSCPKPTVVVELLEHGRFTANAHGQDGNII